jgi:hypothetical protein
MRSLTLRCSPSRRLAAAISKSLYAVWVKAPRAARVGCDAGPVEAEIVGVGTTANGQKHIRTNDQGITGSALDTDGDPVCMWCKGDALGAGAHGYALGFEDVADRLGDVFVFAADEARAHLDDCHGRAEPSVHLREFEPDITAADNYEMLRNMVEREDGAIRQKTNLADAGQIRDDRATADIDEDARRAQRLVSDLDRIRRQEASVTLEDDTAFHAAQPVLDAGARVR